MTVSVTSVVTSYTGDGATVAFPTVFVFGDSADIEVIERVIATGAETTKTLTTDYTVSGGGGAGAVPATGTVTAVTAPASTVQWILRRVVAETQASALPAAGSLPSPTIENMVDRAVMNVQQHSEELGRTLEFPKTDSPSLDPTLPSSVDRLGKLLAFNSVTGEPEMRDLSDGGTGTLSDVVEDNSPQLGGVLDTNARSINESEGSAVASVAGETDIWATDGNILHVTGTNAITSFSAAPRIGARRTIIADGAFTLTHSANLNCPSSADIVCAVGDTFDVYADTLTQHDIQNYHRSSGAALVAALPRSYLAGLGMSNDTDTDHDIAIAVGECRDAANSVNMVLSAILTKQIDATWAAGDDAGGMNDGDAVGVSEWFHVHLLSNAAGTSVDAGFDTSLTAAGLLADAAVVAAGLTKYRRIGSVLTDGSSNILAFTQNGDRFTWDVSIADLSTGVVATAGTDLTLSTPLGVVTTARLGVTQGSNANLNIDIYTKGTTGAQPGFGVPPVGIVGVSGSESAGYTEVDTNTSSQVVARSSTATTDTSISTKGYIDRRGRDD